MPFVSGRRAVLLSAALFGLVAATTGAARAQDKTIKIGVTAGPHAQIVEFVAKQAAKQGLTVKMIEFTDYVTPNIALSSGDLDINSYQNQPFLDRQVADRGYKLVSVAKTVNFPMGVYSAKWKKPADIPAGGKLGIPNDPTNGGRGLLLLETAGLIKLKPGLGQAATPSDVTDNPRKFKFVELDAAQLPRSLSDLDGATINTNFAVSAGLNPLKDAIAIESPQSPYINLLVTRTDNKDKPEIQQFIKIYQTPETAAFIAETFKGAVIVGWQQ